MVHHRTVVELEAGLEHVRNAPSSEGTLELIVRRPNVDDREVLEAGELHPDHGLVGDSWATRNAEAPSPDTQLTLINARAIDLIAGELERWALAGDQLYVDLDLGEANAPPGTQFSVGGAVIVVTPTPHSGCQKFSSRFGVEALRFVNSPEGRLLRLRGIYARVVAAGPIRRGDSIVRLADPASS